VPGGGGICRAQTPPVAGFVFLAIGILCAIIGRIMLIRAAFGVSIWWGLGVFLPFGPLFFRLAYPGLAFASRMFRLATLPCVFLYVLLGPRIAPPEYFRFENQHPQSSPSAAGYAMEWPKTNRRSANSSSPTQGQPTLSFAQRMMANATEFDRLRVWEGRLHLRKRDLLHSDLEGNRVYNLDLADFNSALAKANAEKASLAGAK